MIIPHGKTEFDPIKTKIYSSEYIFQEKKSNNLGLILLSIIMLFLFIFLYFSISINNRTIKYLNNQIQQKEIMIEKIKVQLPHFSSYSSISKNRVVKKYVLIICFIK